MALVRVRMSAPPPVVMLPVISDLELLLAPVTVRESAPSAESVLEPRVTLPVILEVFNTLTASAPLPVVTLPVTFEASSDSESALLAVVVSPSMPRLMLPLTVDAALKVSSSAPEPPVMVAVMAVPEALSKSLPSRLLLSVPREIV